MIRRLSQRFREWFTDPGPLNHRYVEERRRPCEHNPAPEGATPPPAAPTPPPMWKGKDVLRVQVDDPEEFRTRLGQMCGRSVLSVPLSVPLTETDGPRCELCGRKDLTVLYYSLPDMLHEYGHPYTGYACRKCLGKQVVKALGIVVGAGGSDEE